ncbi:hypothetical protein MTF64_12465 [Pseudoalteromonas sp. 2CM41L]|uniref:hypothetical protein n=1 Tax=Pseudoalteromonas sp. 2CM41L TaxID=2929857 RepID=UPI0020BF6E35|nr:hypothetical protein [Pseudoalteromonas sp. 2CM41L]MCK8107690.1 hypothetical protein [Pseudoalteromonas sp. 2CM41L]
MVNTRRLIVGPSHVVRWENGVKNSTLKNIEDTTYFACGGLPIWDKELFKYIKEHQDEFDEITILVGDFRFGNTFQFIDSVRHTGIEKKYITFDNDKYLYKKCLKALVELSEIPSVSFIFWDLAIREYENKKKKKYLVNNEYQHPIWNLYDLENKFKERVLSISQILQYDLDFLFIDSSLHPSVLGFDFLRTLILEKDTTSSLLSCLRLKKKISNYLFTNEEIVICGVSKLYRALLMYVQKGIIHLPDNIQFSRADDALFCKRQEKRRLIFLTDQVEQNKLEEHEIYKTKAKWRTVDIFNSGYPLYADDHLLYEIAGGLPNAFFIISILNNLLMNNKVFIREEYLETYTKLIN